MGKENEATEAVKPDRPATTATDLVVSPSVTLGPVLAHADPYLATPDESPACDEEEGRAWLGEQRNEILAERKVAEEGYAESQRDHDKIIVTLATGGLVVSVGFVEKIIPVAQAIARGVLLASWAAFALALLVALLSHRFAAKAYLSEIARLDKELLERRPPSPAGNNRWSTITTASNWGALTLVFAGVVFFLVFAGINLFEAKASVAADSATRTTAPGLTSSSSITAPTSRRSKEAPR